MVFDPTDPDIDLCKFPREYWLATAYGEENEELTPNTPQERGIGMAMRDFVDLDHIDNTVTRRSRTVFIIFLNNAAI